MSAKTIIATMPYKIKKDTEKEIYRLYMARGMQALCGFKTSFYDLINPKPKDNRTADQVVSDIISKAGIKVI